MYRLFATSKCKLNYLNSEEAFSYNEYNGKSVIMTGVYKCVKELMRFMIKLIVYTALWLFSIYIIKMLYWFQLLSLFFQ